VGAGERGDGRREAELRHIADELAWQANKRASKKEQKEILADVEVFMRLYNREKKFELKRYWLELGAEGEVTKTYERSLAELEAKRPAMEALARCQARVGRFLREMLEYEGAERQLEKALKAMEVAFGSEHKKTAKIHYLLAEVYWNQGKFERAEPHAVRALEIREKRLGSHHVDVAMSLCGLGELYIDRRADEAERALKRAYLIREQHYGSEHPLVARVLQDLALVADNGGEYEKAVELCSRAIEIRRKTLGSGHPFLAGSLEMLGSIHQLAVASCYEWMALSLEAEGEVEGAKKMRGRGKEIREALARMKIEVNERIQD